MQYRDRTAGSPDAIEGAGKPFLLPRIDLCAHYPVGRTLAKTFPPLPRVVCSCMLTFELLHAYPQL